MPLCRSSNKFDSVSVIVAELLQLFPGIFSKYVPWKISPAILSEDPLSFRKILLPFARTFAAALANKSKTRASVMISILSSRLPRRPNLHGSY